jgi:hypothetical protein
MFMGICIMENLIGQVFGHLTVIDSAGDHVSPKGNQAWQWLCKCFSNC